MCFYTPTQASHALHTYNVRAYYDWRRIQIILLHYASVPSQTNSAYVRGAFQDHLLSSTEPGPLITLSVIVAQTNGKQIRERFSTCL